MAGHDGNGSTEPESQAGPCGRSRPRWSVSSQAEPAPPASSAWLVGCGRRVEFRPPLSCSGPRRGSTPVMSPAPSPEQPSLSSTRLPPPEATVPSQSSFGPEALLLEMIVFERLTVLPAAACRPPPPTPPVEELLLIVVLFTTRMLPGPV